MRKPYRVRIRIELLDEDFCMMYGKEKNLTVTEVVRGDEPYLFETAKNAIKEFMRYEGFGK